MRKIFVFVVKNFMKVILWSVTSVNNGIALHALHSHQLN